MDVIFPARIRIPRKGPIEILGLIPAESARGLELEAEGARECLYLAADMSRAWQVFHADSPVEAIPQTFPFAPYTASTITALADPQAG
jgi:hypothetical protein